VVIRASMIENRREFATAQLSPLRRGLNPPLRLRQNVFLCGRSLGIYNAPRCRQSARFAR
jgi:hypothetical protein